MRTPPEEFFQAVAELSTEISSQSQAIKKGDTTNIEELLYAQALTLDAAFHKFLTMATTGTSQPSLMAERFEIITGFERARDQSSRAIP